MTRLVYDWRFVELEDNRTRVILEVEFVGAAHWCMPIWESLREQVISNISQAFMERVKVLQVTVGGDEGRPSLRPKLEPLTSVLQGPFLREEAVVVTESNGRTIRHANKGFAALAGRDDAESLAGMDIPDLLQSFSTDRNVLRGIGAAIRARLPATAVVQNRNQAGDEFMNRLILSPLDDDEKDTGVVFWAILRVVDGRDQRLEFSTPAIFNDAWGPDYKHSDALSGEDVMKQPRTT